MEPSALERSSRSSPRSRASARDYLVILVSQRRSAQHQPRRAFFRSRPGRVPRRAQATPRGLFRSRRHFSPRRAQGSKACSRRSAAWRSPRARATHRARATPRPRAVGNSSSSATTTSVRDAIPARARATRVALSAAAALVLALAPRNDAFAFVPVTGCGDPGSPYDTGVRREDGAAVANCQKLYQPARAAESRAVVAAAAAAAERANTAPGPATTEP